MNKKELSESTDQELLDEAKKTKLSPTANAFFVGIMIGVVIYSVVANTWGFFTLIPLVFAYKLIESSKKDKDLERLLKERNLK